MEPRPEIGRALAYIREHHASRVTLRAMAAAAGLSPYHFLRVFRDATGRTPHAYLVDVRLRRAAWLIATGVPAAAAAARAGFADQSHLTRRFKRRHGMTPGEYARALAQRDASVFRSCAG